LIYTLNKTPLVEGEEKTRTVREIKHREGNKKFELMLTRRTKAYSSSGSVV